MAEYQVACSAGAPLREIGSPYQEPMEKASEAGQISELRRLILEYNRRYYVGHMALYEAKVAKDVEPTPLFTAAICNGQTATVRYLLAAFRDFKLDDGVIVRALLDRPDLEILKLIHSKSPSIVNFSWNSWNSRFLYYACEGGPKNAPFINFLLNHGAAPEGEFKHFGGDLIPAIQHGQPIEVIKKMAPKVTYLFFPIITAIDKKRIDTLSVLLKEEIRRREVLSKESFEVRSKEFIKAARATENGTIIKMVEKFISKYKQQVAPSRNNPENDGSRTRNNRIRRWWQSLWRSDNQSGGKEVGSSKPQTSAPRKWWTFSKVVNKGPVDLPQHRKDSYDSTSSEDTWNLVDKA